MFPRMVLLVACLACAALALDDSGFAYFEVSLGGHYASYSIKTESFTHWYHDTERDEMVYDEDLTYDIFSFEGGGPMLGVQAGFSPGERFVFLLDFGLFVSIGDFRYKLYSRDKDEYAENGGLNAAGAAGQAGAADGDRGDGIHLPAVAGHGLSRTRSGYKDQACQRRGEP